MAKAQSKGRQSSTASGKQQPTAAGKQPSTVKRDTHENTATQKHGSSWIGLVLSALAVVILGVGFRVFYPQSKSSSTSSGVASSSVPSSSDASPTSASGAEKVRDDSGAKQVRDDSQVAGKKAVDAGHCGSGPCLAAERRKALSESSLGMLEELISEVQSSGPAHIVKQHRNFGANTTYQGGHEVTYLHQHVKDDMLSVLWDAALAADDVMPTWKLRSRIKSHGRLSLRCLELIDYFPKVEQQSQNEKNSLSWHHDGATVFTVAVSLSNAGEDFEGGEFSIKDPSDAVQTISDLRRGDVLTWRGWDEHQVNHVTSGQRRVVVAEWWLGASCDEKESRPVDTQDVLRRTLPLDRTSPWLYRILGNLQTESGELAGAEDSFRTALKYRPQFPGDLSRLSNILMQRGSLEEAEKQARNCLSIDPKFAEARLNLGMILHSRGDLKGAISNLKASVKLKPSDATALKNLGTALYGGQDLAGAAGAFRKSLKIAPSAEVQTQLGMVSFAQGDQKAAEENFRKSIGIDPKYMIAHYHLGGLLANRGKLPEAQKTLKVARRLEPTDADVHARLGTLLLNSGDRAKAKESFATALRLENTNMEAIQGLAKIGDGR